MNDPEPWFAYYSGPDRFKSWPIHWKGWVAIVAVTVAPIAGFFSLRAVNDDRLLLVAYTFFAGVAVIAISLKLILSRGRRVKSLKS